MFKESLQKSLNNYYEQLGELEIERSFSASAAQNFELKKRIENCREEIKKIETEIQLIENSEKTQSQGKSTSEENPPSQKKDDTLEILLRTTVKE